MADSSMGGGRKYAYKFMLKSFRAIFTYLPGYLWQMTNFFNDFYFWY
jgi:hypothetical protein